MATRAELKVQKLYSDLAARIRQLEAKFIEKYIPPKPTDGADVFGDDVRAFGVLAHSAFEEFAEQVALIVSKETSKAFSTGKKIGRSTASMCAFAAHRKHFDDYMSGKKAASSFDCIRALLSEAHGTISNDATNNNGFAVSYLAGLLLPVGVDIPDDGKIISSIGSLASFRGAAAHRSSSATKIPGPEKIKELVVDCLAGCQCIAKSAGARLSEVS